MWEEPEIVGGQRGRVQVWTSTTEETNLIGKGYEGSLFEN